METGTKVVYSRNCKSYLTNLGYKLFEKDYFGFLINAKDYVNRIVAEIESSISTKQHKAAPIRFKKYGNHYITIKTTKRTTWYVFFFREKDTYFVNFITNNHVSAHYIRGLR